MAGPISIGVGLSIADQILGHFGINPTSIGARILNSGDKRKRLEQIEMLGNSTAMHVANTLKAIEGVESEMASAIKDGLLLTMSQTLAAIVKAADLDGSSSGG